MSVRNKPKKKAAKKAVKKVPVKEAAKAFENIFTPIEKKGAPEPLPDAENWDVDDFDPNAPADESEMRVVKVGGETISIAESDALERPPEAKPEETEDLPVDESPVPPKAGIPPSEDIVPPAPQKPRESLPVKQETPILREEDYPKVVESLIDALNYLYPLAKRKLKGKDTPLLEKRVARGRQLIKQLEKEIES